MAGQQSIFLEHHPQPQVTKKPSSSGNCPVHTPFGVIVTGMVGQIPNAQNMQRAYTKHMYALALLLAQHADSCARSLGACNICSAAVIAGYVFMCFRNKNCCALSGCASICLGKTILFPSPLNMTKRREKPCAARALAFGDNHKQIRALKETKSTVMGKDKWCYPLANATCSSMTHQPPTVRCEPPSGAHPLSSGTHHPPGQLNGEAQ